ncbi:MAG: right-handed parallel beta-helix repeat-containing protein [Acidobacteriaceae bacterium]|nr:right-handed parallel beta-helix repeat-containing protein [Acidobacteriaceae bacterium]
MSPDSRHGTGSQAPEGTQYYLSPNGDDNADGKTLQTAWKTFHHAQYVLREGDTLSARGGNYPDTCFFPPAGTKEHPITIRAYKNETPIITGHACWNLFFAIYHDWVNISGLSFDNTSDDNGIIYLRNAHHVTFRKNKFTNNHGATDILLTSSSDVVIGNNEFDTTGNPSGEGTGDNIYVAGSTRVLIEHNTMKHAGHAAIDVINDGDAISAFNVIRANVIEQYWGGGIYVTRGSHDNLVDGNRIEHAGEGCTYPKAGLQIASAHNIIRYNVVNKTSSHPLADNGIALYAYTFSGIRQDATDNRIYNNVVYGAGHAALYIWVADTSVLTRNRVLNNIFYRDKTAGPQEPYWPPGNYYLGFELYHAVQKWQAFPNNNYFYNNLILHADASGDHPGIPIIYYDTQRLALSLKQAQQNYPDFFFGDIERDPMFEDAPAGNFQLKTESPAIGAGADLTTTTAAGQNTSQVGVHDASFFSDGFGVMPGDLIRIGANQPVRIKSIDYNSNLITLEQPVSFKSGDPVNLALGRSTHPDMGAIPQ